MKQSGVVVEEGGRLVENYDLKHSIIKKVDPHEPTTIFFTEYLLYIDKGSAKKSKCSDVFNKLGEP